MYAKRTVVPQYTYVQICCYIYLALQTPEYRLPVHKMYVLVAMHLSLRLQEAGQALRWAALSGHVPVMEWPRSQNVGFKNLSGYPPTSLTIPSNN